MPGKHRESTCTLPQSVLSGGASCRGPCKAERTSALLTLRAWTIFSLLPPGLDINHPSLDELEAGDRGAIGSVLGARDGNVANRAKSKGLSKTGVGTDVDLGVWSRSRITKMELLSLLVAEKRQLALKPICLASCLARPTPRSLQRRKAQARRADMMNKAAINMEESIPCKITTATNLYNV